MDFFLVRKVTKNRMGLSRRRQDIFSIPERVSHLGLMANWGDSKD